MSLKRFQDNLKEIEIDLAWSHWNRLGAMGSGELNKCSTDPEALILLTSIVGRHDLRLVEVMKEWLYNYESLVSIERLKRYVKELSVEADATDSPLEIFREIISERSGGRWSSVSARLKGRRSKNAMPDNMSFRRRKLEAHDKILVVNRQLFLRLLFGVGSRADIIYYAGVVHNQQNNPFHLLISAPHITRMLHYNNSSIFRTLCDLEQAGVIVIDTKIESKKNKVYRPNAHSKGASDLFRAGAFPERSFVDWFGIVKICLNIESLGIALGETKEESIIKSRLSDFISSTSALMNKASIVGVSDLPANVALKNIEREYLMKHSTLQIQTLYDYIT